MMMISKPNFKRAEQAAYTLLKQNHINQLPIKVKKLTRGFKNLRIITYSRFAEENNMTTDEVIVFAGSEEGCCYYRKSEHKYMILYNDLIQNEGRRRWTIAHEIGHYLLKHNEITNKTILSRSSLTQHEYKIFEQEADCFARSLLAPTSVLLALKKFNANDLSKWCSLSINASTNILKFFNKGIDLGRRLDPNDKLVKLFRDYIFKKNTEYQCLRCKVVFYRTSPSYCPVCRSKKISGRLGESHMIYEGYALDENGRANRCPKCDNEEIIEGEFCKVCGEFIINRCDNRYHDRDGDLIIECAQVADGNARYCFLCGHETTFFKNGLLQQWKIDYKDIKKSELRSELEALDEEVEIEIQEEKAERDRERTRASQVALRSWLDS
ncbi:Zn-dependent peptidase ImmA (M78 family)/DNA-directed RNA polymerase subunit RPC12/RpoP [Paenibacillus sp. LBL]|uniref:ImmA/IrrE family metallo-endopeptidase n=1 Tax=Paenibacillus sp. LBL TaxID=2940563 RepID=UPI002473CA2A|nr:ImmA/IrrE family metallo-endopeptidase [Paenibacillus sp. LBL]MDH6673187.1 Zn-dependent peptidase ImmA (M78 family)/DNA-directed RNA polymerase subunit RPC12/RpoP [Paenibacillus sp. LBL]